MRWSRRAYCVCLIYFRRLLQGVGKKMVRLEGGFAKHVLSPMLGPGLDVPIVGLGLEDELDELRHLRELTSTALGAKVSSPLAPSGWANL